jgi:type I restriction enzyme S subunit
MASETWREISIGALCDMGAAQTQTGPFGSQLHSSDYVVNGVPVIPTEAIRRRHLVTEGIPQVSKETAERLSRHLLKRGDILFARRGVQATGLSAIIKPFHEGSLCGTGAILLRILTPEIDTEYLSFFLSAEATVSWLRQHAVGAVMPNLNEGVIRQLAITLPPLSEQRAIASVLGALDDKIDLNRRMCQTLEEMARALFKSWFVDFDPVRAKMEGRDPGLPKEIADLFPSRLVDSELGPIPEGWTASNFGCIAEARREGVAANQIDAATKYIGLEHMPRRSISLWEWESGDAIESNKSRFAKGDILFGKLRPYFHKVGVAPIDGVCSTDIIVIQPKNRAAFSAVLGLASSDDFVAYTDKRSAGTRMPRTNWSDMAAYPVAVPPSAVLSAHDSIIRPLAERIASAIHEVRLLQALRDTLLPKLIAGEVRVPASLGSMQEMAS